MDNLIVKVGFFRFLITWFTCFSIHKTIDSLCKRYQAENLQINLLWKQLFVFRSSKLVKGCLKKHCPADISWLNDNFFASHGHEYGIGNLRVSPLWNLIHHALFRALTCPEMISYDVKNNADILLINHGTRYNLNEVLSEFTMKVWAQYCFGKKVDFEKYQNVRTVIMRVLNRNFYHTGLSTVPFWGKLKSTFFRKLSKAELQYCDDGIRELIAEAEEQEFNYCFVRTFKEKLNECYDVPLAMRNCILIDNCFLMFLVYDFWYMKILLAMYRIAERKVDDTPGRLQILKETRAESFLFPLRMRQMLDTYEHPAVENLILKKGDLVLLDLVSSNLLFSYGPRACVGVGLTDKFNKSLFNILEGVKFRLTQTDLPLLIHPDPNTPFIISQHEVQIKLDKNYLKQCLPYYEHKGIEKFYDVTSIPESPLLLSYITSKFAQWCVEMEIDTIVAPEARGFLFASPVAYELRQRKVSCLVMRIPGKIPGEVYSTGDIQKKYDKAQKLEVSQSYFTLGNRIRRIAVIDDGIASGATLKSIYSLFDQIGFKIHCVMVVIKHNYVECQYDETPVKHIFEL